MRGNRVVLNDSKLRMPEYIGGQSSSILRDRGEVFTIQSWSYSITTGRTLYNVFSASVSGGAEVDSTCFKPAPVDIDDLLSQLHDLIDDWRSDASGPPSAQFLQAADELDQLVLDFYKDE